MNPSLHAPEVECIAKGKAHKKYEFGCKVSVVTTCEEPWVISILAHPGNPYDGSTLKEIPSCLSTLFLKNSKKYFTKTNMPVGM